jgi:hypothetical protein
MSLLRLPPYIKDLSVRFIPSNIIYVFCNINLREVFVIPSLQDFYSVRYEKWRKLSYPKTLEFFPPIRYSFLCYSFYKD